MSCALNLMFTCCPSVIVPLSLLGALAGRTTCPSPSSSFSRGQVRQKSLRQAAMKVPEKKVFRA